MSYFPFIAAVLHTLIYSVMYSLSRKVYVVFFGTFSHTHPEYTIINRLPFFSKCLFVHLNNLLSKILFQKSHYIYIKTTFSFYLLLKSSAQSLRQMPRLSIMSRIRLLTYHVKQHISLSSELLKFRI